MRDLYLEKVQAFTTNTCFGKSITTWPEKKLRRNELLNIWGRVKHLKLENMYNWLLCMCLWKPIDVLDNIPKYSLYVFPALFVFCKINMFLLSSVSNMINDSVNYWVEGHWVSGLILIFSILTTSKKQISSSEVVTRIFN